MHAPAHCFEMFRAYAFRRGSLRPAGTVRPSDVVRRSRPGDDERSARGDRAQGSGAVGAAWTSDIVAGAGGIEPPNDGIKIRCLTAWRRPMRGSVPSIGTRAADVISRPRPGVKQEQLKSGQAAAPNPPSRPANQLARRPSLRHGSEQSEASRPRAAHSSQQTPTGRLDRFQSGSDAGGKPFRGDLQIVAEAR